MKKVYSTFLFLFLTSICFAQGISVQGIARDAANSAIKNSNLTFTFSITKADNTVLFEETQSIRTDNFGVFSHIVGTGNPQVATFNSIDFALKELRLKISVAPNGNKIEIYNQPFQYSPYAHYAKRAAKADNGAPTGSIMPFVGTTAPEGWALCDGSSIASVTDGAALRALIGDFTPDLRGVFLRGTGANAKTGYTNYEGPNLKEFQKDENKEHLHNVDINTSMEGEHSHEETNTTVISSPIGYLTGPTVRSFLSAAQVSTPQTDVQENHNHNVKGETENSGTESRPVNFGVNYIIKL
ncbi:phage tail protein [Polaribacter litorisediminis]|uniref:phage tail protein n=1 Tax=Polaribacter litorisediminis TaxID=1908341 RepID=UPI001CC0BA4F|nr:phage tail protein [Polaribacter litorisediminis]UAM98357.1 phage tail protein [Polaribacter litorisediminis]